MSKESEVKNMINNTQFSRTEEINDLKKQIQMRGITQASLLLKLREMGLIVYPTDISNYLNGYIISPKSKKVLQAIDKILND